MDPLIQDPTQNVDAYAAAQQDAQRSARLFINAAIANLFGDEQIYPSTDGVPSNQAGQWTVYNPGAGGGLAVEGKAYTANGVTTAGGSVRFTPMALLLIVGLGVLLLRHH